MSRAMPEPSASLGGLSHNQGGSGWRGSSAPWDLCGRLSAGPVLSPPVMSRSGRGEQRVCSALPGEAS